MGQVPDHKRLKGAKIVYDLLQAIGLHEKAHEEVRRQDLIAQVYKYQIVEKENYIPDF